MECTICLERLLYKHKKILGCKHGFHKICITNLYQQTQGVAKCPLCRTPFRMRIKQSHLDQDGVVDGEANPPTIVEPQPLPQPQLPITTNVPSPIHIHVHRNNNDHDHVHHHVHDHNHPPSIYPLIITQPGYSTHKTIASNVIQIHLTVGSTQIQIKIE